MTGLSWAAALVGAGVWTALYAATRTVSIGSLAAAVAIPVAVAALERGRPGGAFGGILAFSIAMGLLILVRHRSNLARLLKGEELKFGAKK
jgi:glycerol-3-phosphate acyltransferase PlsY